MVMKVFMVMPLWHNGRDIACDGGGSDDGVCE
jgi:hypothetical protein